MKSSELLKMARERLWGGEGESYPQKIHICVSIGLSCAREYGDYDHTQARELRRHVMSLLEEEDTMEGFLAKQLGIQTHSLRDKIIPAEIQQKRFELIDKLIAEYEEKGD